MIFTYMKNTDLSPILIRLLFALVFILSSVEMFSQETRTCAEKLKTAQSLFEKGQVETIPSLLIDCLKSGFKKEEEIIAYKLLIQTYLLNDKIEQADSTMQEFLKLNPEYQLSRTDHSSFVYLFNKFEVKPVVKLGVHAGMSIPYVTFVSTNLTSGENGESKFTSNVGNIYISLESKFKLTEKLEFGLEAGFVQLKFTNKTTSDFASVSYTESQQHIEIPLNITYDFASFGKFKVYSRLGIGGSLTIGVSGSASTTLPNSIRPPEILNRKDSRIGFDVFGQVGLGLKYKISRGFIFGEVRTNLGMLQQNVPGGGTIQKTDNYYLWRDPDFRLNTLNINFGYTYIFYKPAKRKE
jgi:hypothetical protein